MGRSIRFSAGTDTIVSTAAKIDNYNDEFYSEYTEFYSVIEGELKANWKGEDSDAFNQKADNVKPLFTEIKEIISDYATCLRNAANAHESRMEESRSQADSLGSLGD